MIELDENKTLLQLLQENADLDLLTTKDAVKVVRKWLKFKLKEQKRNLAYSKSELIGEDEEPVIEMIEAEIQLLKDLIYGLEPKKIVLTKDTGEPK